jgi:hypothetical protein
VLWSSTNCPVATMKLARRRCGLDHQKASNKTQLGIMTKCVYMRVYVYVCEPDEESKTGMPGPFIRSAAVLQSWYSGSHLLVFQKVSRGALT